MISDRQRQVLQHPVRSILQRAAGMRSTPDESELAELDMPDVLRDKVRLAARAVVDTAERGGMRSRHDAAAMAERLSAELAAAVPREYSHSVATDSDGPNEPDSAELAERVMARMSQHPSQAEDVEDRETTLRALRLIHGRHRG